MAIKDIQELDAKLQGLSREFNNSVKEGNQKLAMQVVRDSRDELVKLANKNYNGRRLDPELINAMEQEWVKYLDSSVAYYDFVYNDMNANINGQGKIGSAVNYEPTQNAQTNLADNQAPEQPSTPSSTVAMPQNVSNIQANNIVEPNEQSTVQNRPNVETNKTTPPTQENQNLAQNNMNETMVDTVKRLLKNFDGQKEISEDMVEQIANDVFESKFDSRDLDIQTELAIRANIEKDIGNRLKLKGYEKVNKDGKYIYELTGEAKKFDIPQTPENVKSDLQSRITKEINEEIEALSKELNGDLSKLDTDISLSVKYDKLFDELYSPYEMEEIMQQEDGRKIRKEIIKQLDLLLTNNKEKEEYISTQENQNLRQNNANNIVKQNSTIQGLEDYTVQDIKDLVMDHIQEVAGDIQIKGIALNGSRVRGDSKANSDLDVVVEYDGQVSEDTLFNALNEEPLEIEGIKVDINPITASKSGTLEEYMKRSKQYDTNKNMTRYKF
jgi:predicted nucleotidyltransferase